MWDDCTPKYYFYHLSFVLFYSGWFCFFTHLLTKMDFLDFPVKSHLCLVSHLFGITKLFMFEDTICVTVSLQLGDTSWTLTLLYSHGMPFFVTPAQQKGGFLPSLACLLCQWNAKDPLLNLSVKYLVEYKWHFSSA